MHTHSYNTFSGSCTHIAIPSVVHAYTQLYLQWFMHTQSYTFSGERWFVHTHSYNTFSGSCTHIAIPSVVHAYTQLYLQWFMHTQSYTFSGERWFVHTHSYTFSGERWFVHTHSYTFSGSCTHTQLYLQQAGLDVLIIHELREDVEFLPQELVCKVDLRGCRTHGVMDVPTLRKCDVSSPVTQLTVVFMMPVPWVRMELATWRMFMVFRCLLLEERSTKICGKEHSFSISLLSPSLLHSVPCPLPPPSPPPPPPRLCTTATYLPDC